jgi:nucleoporin GLE1
MDVKSKKKAMGVKDGESAGDYVTRVAGLMRLYFEVMKISIEAPTPLESEWRFPRAWTWLTRLIGRPGMLGSTAAPLCIFGESLSKNGYICLFLTSNF